MTLLVDDPLSGTSGADLTTDATTAFAKIGTPTLLFTASGTVRNSGGTQALYHNSSVAPPVLHRVIGVVSALGTLITGFQAGLAGRIPAAPSPTAQDNYTVRVNALDTTGTNTKLNLIAMPAAGGTGTTLVTYTVPSWGPNVDHTIVLGLGVSGTQIIFLDGVPVMVTFDTTISRAGHAGVSYGATTQLATQGYQLTEFAIDDLTDAPTVTSGAVTITGTFQQGQVLTAAPPTWSGGDTHTWQWLRSDSSGTGLGYTAIPGATGNTYTLQAADVNHSLIAVDVRSTGAPGANLLGAGSAVSSPTGTILPPAPVLHAGSTPTIAWQTGTDPQAVGSTIVITPATYDNSPTIQTVILQRNVGGAGWVNVQTFGGGAGSYPLGQQTYITQAADGGAQMRVLGSAANASGTSSQTASNVLNVQSPGLTGADMKWRLSGGASNPDPQAAHGGPMSSVAAPSTLFPPVPGDAVVTAAYDDYVQLYLLNDNAGEAGDAFVYLLEQWAGGVPAGGGAGETLSIGLATEGVNADVAPTPDRFTAPVGVAFSSPLSSDGSTPSGALHPGTVPAKGRYGVWLRRHVPVGATPVSGDPAQIRANVTPL